MNIAITTGDQVHHKYLINVLKRYFPDDIKLVIIQKMSKKNPSKRNWLLGKTKNIFLIFIKLISYDFRGLRFPSEIEFFYTSDVNSVDVYNLLKKRKIDLLLVCGGKIIKDNILNILNGKIINIHNGYSPYYKGSYTLFFPIIENKHYLVGTTIHWLTKDVDGGDIILRNRFYPDNYFFKDFLFIDSFKKSIDSLVIILRLFLANFSLPLIRDYYKTKKVYYGKEFDLEKSKLINKKLHHLFFKKYLIIK